jgi:hypothetical protein
MKATLTLLGIATAVLFAVAPVFADCELGCSAECKQETAICVGTANLDAHTARAQCESDASDAALGCESDSIDARSDCVGLCGPDLKDCVAAAKVAFKQCKDQAKIDLAGCENDVATQLDADKTACAQDAADCNSTCVQ